jgi:MFS family permease
MTSLSEVYEGGRGGADLRRLYLGVVLFSVGAILTVFGIAVGTSTAVADSLSLGVFEARELAGIAAGLGLPATFLGVVTVLPQAGRRVRIAAVLGSAIALVAVVVFQSVYPSQWYGQPVDYTLPVTAVYFVGAITTLWALFSAVANFKTRNDPGGTVKLRITKQGETQVVEVSNDDLRSRLSGIGFFGSTPDGDVETQTAGQSSTPTRNRASTATTDGGATTDDAVFLDEPDPKPRGDVYCGNCSHFKYVRTGSGLKPYCGLHAETMSDMEPCQQWEENTSDGIDRVE